VDTLGWQSQSLDYGFPDAVGHGYDGSDILKHQAINQVSSDRQIVMPGEYESRFCSATGESRNEIISSHVRVNYIYAVMIDYFRDGAGRLHIERVAKRKFMPGGDDSGKRRAKRAFRSYGEIDCMAARGKRAHEIGNVNFAAAHL
jgi:hypothetical protein